jgi:acyl-CoA hydrolase
MTQRTKLTLSQIMLPQQTNLGGSVHGGEIFKMMDMIAGAVCQQYTNTRIITVRVDDLRFLSPVSVGDYVICTARIAYVGRTSIDVLVTVEAEGLKTGTALHRVASAFFTNIAADDEGRPKKAPPLAIVDEEQRRLCALAETRRAENKRRAVLYAAEDVFA